MSQEEYILTGCLYNLIDILYSLRVSRRKEPHPNTIKRYILRRTDKTIQAKDEQL